MLNSKFCANFTSPLLVAVFFAPACTGVRGPIQAAEEDLKEILCQVIDEQTNTRTDLADDDSLFAKKVLTNSSLGRCPTTVTDVLAAFDKSATKGSRQVFGVS